MGGVKLSPVIRGPFRKLVKKGMVIKDIAHYFETTRQTVHRLRRASIGNQNFPRQPKESKVTMEVELSILKLRTTFK